MAKNKSDVVPLLNEIGFKLDDEIVKVIGLLEGKGAVAELDIAEALGVKINSARKLLYRLNSLNIATYSKKRDEEKKWWYIYFWTLDDRRIKDLFMQKKSNLLKAKKEELEAE
jgi:transcription initiation factor TFIIE subunit alpha